MMQVMLALETQMLLAAVCFAAGSTFYGLSFRRRLSFDVPIVSATMKAFLGASLLLLGFVVFASAFVSR
jgi:hypothetical protein